MSYIGRFAPTPSGPLHMGSLVCALISYLDAHYHNGQWLVRIDDLDTPRVKPKAIDHILALLKTHALAFDGLFFQSERTALYTEKMQALIAKNQCFKCCYSRKALIAQFNGLHPGKHVAKPPTSIEANPFDNSLNTLTNPLTYTIRADVNDSKIVWQDRWLSEQRLNLRETMGAFTLLRRDGYFSYHFASAIDDYTMGITDVVRGRDLVESTFAHVFLYQLFNWQLPRYAHHFLVYNPLQQKLSKQHGALALNIDNASANIKKALELMQMPAPIALQAPQDLIQWAKTHYTPERIQCLTNTLYTETTEP